MISLEQRQFLKNKNKILLDKLLAFEKDVERQQIVSVEKSKNNMDTLKIKFGEKDIYYHSKYNPIREADVFSDDYLDLSQYKHVLFVGTGLGYHIEKILNANPNLKYSIYEPSIEILYHYLSREKSKVLKQSKLVEIFNDIAELIDIEIFFNNYSKDSITITWNTTKQLFLSEIDKFQHALIEKGKSNKRKMSAYYWFQERWTINTLSNLSKIINSPNILLDINENIFKNKPIILVAAGPSLSYEWDNLRKIKEKKLAYICAVGSAINALIEQDITPDAFFTFDPKKLNETVVEKMKERKINNVPVVFGTTVAPGVLEGLHTPLLHFISNRDSITPYLIGNKEVPGILDSPTVSIMTYQIMAYLNVSHIILVGQNLSFLDNKVYADGIKYNHLDESVIVQQNEKHFNIEDVDGNSVATDDSFNNMLKDFERCISVFNNVKVINTTKRGAKIKGAPFMDLEAVIEEVLVEENVTNSDWYKFNNNYDLDFLTKQFDKLKSEADKLDVLLKKAVDEILKINNLYERKVLINVQTNFMQFDKILSDIFKNDYFKIVLLPTLQNQKSIFTKRSKEVALEKKPLKKVELFNDIFGKFIQSIYGSYVSVTPKFYEIDVQENISE